MTTESDENIDISEFDAVENDEWCGSLDAVIDQGGNERASDILQVIQSHARTRGASVPFSANTPYINTIPTIAEPPYPGDLEIERRIRSIIRWNAMAMVVRANRLSDGIGGHISSYASSATLYEVAFNHFFRASQPAKNFVGDHIYFQGHVSPGIYARAFLEGRISEQKMENFRRELQPGGGLSSYPHPWLMPDFWQFPTVSMGLSPIMAIYHARYKHYLEDRGLKQKDDSKVWAFLGDGETDEPETLGAITLAAREQLDNLIFVINCNLQRLDGPVRGNGKIIQELEAVFRGAGWNVIKVVWGRRWDPLLEMDSEGWLLKRMNEVIDGEYQKYRASDAAYIRKHFFGKYPQLADMVAHLSDDDIWQLNRGGHDSVKMHAAYKAAVESQGKPTVILAKTIKGYGMGEAGEGRNVTHQQKKLNENSLHHFRDRFGIPLSDAEITKAPFFRPDPSSPEIQYLMDKRAALGGFVPSRQTIEAQLNLPDETMYEEFKHDSGDRNVATTMACVRLIGKLMRDKSVGAHIVPIVPDECRTFGMESFFREFGIYSHVGQKYEPVDSDTVLYYREATDGQLLEEGITEAGAMSSFIAAGTAHSTMGITTIPFFIYYSMFGMQRIGDLVWAAGDIRCRGFMLGATAGRTTLAGEGLQHQDGHSHLLAYPHPSLLAYDPSFAFEVATIIKDGLHRMHVRGEDLLYYLTLGNEPYHQPAMPEGVEDGIIKGMYRFNKSSLGDKAVAHAQLLGSGAIMPEVLKAQIILAENYNVAADVWSVTSYKQVHRDLIDTERWNWRNPISAPRIPYVGECLNDTKGIVVAASDYVKALPESIRAGTTRPWISLGTDGYGRSESREDLRNFFEVDAKQIAFAALVGCLRNGEISEDTISKAMIDLKIDSNKPNPAYI